jgi:hypothetical protein
MEMIVEFERVAAISHCLKNSVLRGIVATEKT